MSEGRVQKAERLFKHYLKKKRLFHTPERRAILREVLSIAGHFEADELYFRIRQKSKRKISRATVYRTLPLLEESGVIRKVAFVDKHTHYEQVYEQKHHEHLICVTCGKVIDFYRKSLEDALQAVARENHFEPVAHKLEITGYCRDCQ